MNAQLDHHMEELWKIPEMFILLPFFFLLSVRVWNAVSFNTHIESLGMKTPLMFTNVFFSLFFCCLDAVAQHFPTSLCLSIKANGSWLVIDSTEVFESDRLTALYITGRPDGWVRVQGWSLRIQSKAWSILTMLTWRTLTWWAPLFSTWLILTLTCCGSKRKATQRTSVRSSCCFCCFMFENSRCPSLAGEQQLINCVSNSCRPSCEDAGSWQHMRSKKKRKRNGGSQLR